MKNKTKKMQNKKWNSKKFWREFEKYMLVNQKQLLITDKEQIKHRV